MRFQKRIEIFPGLRLNLSKSGLGLSAGIRGTRIGVDAKGRNYSSVGIPGTGLSSRSYGKPSAFAALPALLIVAALIVFALTR